MTNHKLLYILVFFMLLGTLGCSANPTPVVMDSGEAVDGLVLTVSINNTVYSVGEPILVTVSVKNVSSGQEIVVNKCFTPDLNLDFSIQNLSGGEITQPFMVNYTCTPGPLYFVALAPGDALDRTIDIQAVGPYEPGIYTLQAFYRNAIDPDFAGVDQVAWKGELASNSVRFTVQEK